VSLIVDDTPIQMIDVFDFPGSGLWANRAWRWHIRQGRRSARGGGQHGRQHQRSNDAWRTLSRGRHRRCYRRWTPAAV